MRPYTCVEGASLPSTAPCDRVAVGVLSLLGEGLVLVVVCAYQWFWLELFHLLLVIIVTDVSVIINIWFQLVSSHSTEDL